MVITEIKREPKFDRGIKHIKNRDIKERVKTLIKKLVNEPSEKHHLRYDKKKEQKIYVGKYRLLYAYKNDILYLIDFDHRNTVYKKR